MKEKHSQTPASTHAVPLPPGLYLVATPIGNLADITFRAVTTLKSVATIFCEDTRITSRLLKHYGINTRLETYHEHNAAKKRPQMIDDAKKHAIALVSDAGTPLISDPGFKLVREALEDGVNVQSIPGPSSALTALCKSGLSTKRFLFEGFLPTKDGQARQVLRSIARVPSTLIFFESPKRVADSLARMRDELGGEREAALLRELTKLYEEGKYGSLESLAEHYANAPEPRGEVVIVIGPPPEDEGPSGEEVMELLIEAMARTTLKTAVEEVSMATGIAKKAVYQLALAIRDASEEEE